MQGSLKSGLEPFEHLLHINNLTFGWRAVGDITTGVKIQTIKQIYPTKNFAVQQNPLIAFVINVFCLFTVVNFPY